MNKMSEKREERKREREKDGEREMTRLDRIKIWKVGT